MEKIGLQSVFETTAFASGIQKYVGGLNFAEVKTKSVGSILTGALSGLATAGVAAFAAMGAAIVGAGALIVGTAAKVIFETTSWAHEMGVLQAKTGLSFETLQQYDYIATILGVDLEAIVGTQARLSRAMYAAQKPTTAQAQAFKALGVSVVDAKGDLRDADTVLFEVLDALSKMENPTEADALAMQVLGRGAMELAPLMRAGKGSLEEMKAEAVALGLVLSDETVAAFDEFDEELDKIKMTSKNMVKNFFRPLLPLFKTFADVVFKALASPKVQEGIKKMQGYIGDFAQTASQRLVPFMDNLMKIGSKVWAWVEQKVIPGMKTLFDWLGVRFPDLLNDFSLSKLLDFFTDFGQVLADLIGPIDLEGFAKNIATAISGVDWSKYGAEFGKVVSDIVGVITGFFTGEGGESSAAGELAKSLGTAFADFVVGALTQRPSATFQTEIADVWAANFTLIGSAIKNKKYSWGEFGGMLIMELFLAMWNNPLNLEKIAIVKIADLIDLILGDLIDKVLKTQWGQVGGMMIARVIKGAIVFFPQYFHDLEMTIQTLPKRLKYISGEWQTVGAQWVSLLKQGYGGPWGIFVGNAITSVGALIRSMGNMKETGASWSDLGKAFVSGLWDGFSQMWVAFYDDVMELVNTLVSDAWDLLSQIINAINSVGGWTGSGWGGGGGGTNPEQPYDPNKNSVQLPQSSVGNKGVQVLSPVSQSTTYNIVVNNPSGEAAGLSIDATMKKISFLGSR